MEEKDTQQKNHFFLHVYCIRPVHQLASPYTLGLFSLLIGTQVLNFEYSKTITNKHTN